MNGITSNTDYVLVTGATGMVGRAVAEKLVINGCPIILTSADEESLAELSDQLAGKNHTAVQTIVEDLSLRGGGARLYNALNVAAIAVDKMVYCPEAAVHAAFSEAGKKSTSFAAAEMLEEQATVQREILSLTELVKCLGIEMLRRNHGRMIVVNSDHRRSALRDGVNAFQAAFCREVSREWRAKGVTITTCRVKIADQDIHAANRAAQRITDALQGNGKSLRWFRDVFGS